MSQNAPASTTTLSSCILRSVAAADGALERRPRVSPRARRIGLAVMALPLLFLVMDALVKVFGLAAASEATAQLGWSDELLLPLGILQLVCLALYVMPQTSVLGAILWTGYLGGAVATHVRVGNPMVSHVLFPIYVGSLLWLGLWLRDARLRTLLPITTRR